LGDLLQRLDAPVILKVAPLPMNDDLRDGQRAIQRRRILREQTTTQKGQGRVLRTRGSGDAASGLKKRLINRAAPKGSAQKVANHAGAAE